MGTGPGRLLLQLAQGRSDLRLVGVDPSEDMIRRGRDHARTAGLEDGIEFETVPAESLPFAAGTFDLVLSTLSAHHWADPTAAINEQVRVLRPGGQLRIYDLRREGLEGLLRSWHRQWAAQCNTGGGWPESWDRESDA